VPRCCSQPTWLTTGCKLESITPSKIIPAHVSLSEKHRMCAESATIPIPIGSLAQTGMSSACKREDLNVYNRSVYRHFWGPHNCHLSAGHLLELQKIFPRSGYSLV